MPQQIDAYLDPATGDLPEVSRLVTGLDLIQQRIRLRLQRGQGEWFLDPSVGLPLIEWRSFKPPLSEVVALVEDEIRSVPGVIEIQGFEASLDLQRKLTITGSVRYATGDVTSILVSGGIDPARNSAPLAVFFGSGTIRGGLPRPATGRP